MPEFKTVAVVDKNGRPLMPTNSYRARHLLEDGKAEIYSYRPIFTIRMLARDGGDVQPIELKIDAGYQHIGISVCSEKHEYVHREYDLLSDEPERHRDASVHRRERRSRLRYRQPRFDNRKGSKICKDGFAPSVRNKRDRHVDLATSLCQVMLITTCHIEIGSFDTQVLAAVDKGEPLPEGTDYQHGKKYGYATLREAVLSRDGYTCQCCGKNAFKDGVILACHHIGYYMNDRTDRLDNLMTVCTECHTSKNHKPGGKLYGLKPKLKTLKEVAFMNSVRWSIVEKLKEVLPGVEVKVTYGAATKLARNEFGLPKTHANDAYSMGEFHPKHRAHEEHFKKQRRNNRILERFYDARYIDVRDGKTKKGNALGCNRTDRSEPRMSAKNERIYRKEKVSKGHRSIRKERYPLRPGDIVYYDGKKCQVAGSSSYGKQAVLKDKRYVSVNKIILVKHSGGWIPA